MFNLTEAVRARYLIENVLLGGSRHCYPTSPTSTTSSSSEEDTTWASIAVRIVILGFVYGTFFALKKRFSPEKKDALVSARWPLQRLEHYYNKLSVHCRQLELVKFDFFFILESRACKDQKIHSSKIWFHLDSIKHYFERFRNFFLRRAEGVRNEFRMIHKNFRWTGFYFGDDNKWFKQRGASKRNNSREEIGFLEIVAIFRRRIVNYESRSYSWTARETRRAARSRLS